MLSNFLRGVIVSVLAVGYKVRGFIPGRWRYGFKGNNNLQQDFLRRGRKAVGTMS
jgi:hypothetical protein